MATYKYIYWRPDIPKNEKGEGFAHVHLLVGDNQGTITDFQSMANKLRETFPQAEDKDIYGGRVHKSSFCNGFTIIAWNEYVPVGDYPGWDQVKNGKMEYFW